VDRDVLIEAGYRCAMPRCEARTLDVHHIVDHAKGGPDTFDNLIALCPNCHRMVTDGRVDRKAVQQIKANLSVLNHQYSDLERRILLAFADDGSAGQIVIEYGLQIMFQNLLRDGFLVHLEGPPMAFGSSTGIQMHSGPTLYGLTQSGREFVDRWAGAEHLA
jgi:hypothetical protein